jgi:hypothetical protein
MALSEIDTELMKYYMWGFRDERNGNSRVVEGKLKVRAYLLGAMHAEENRSSEAMYKYSDAQIMNMIKSNEDFSVG